MRPQAQRALRWTVGILGVAVLVGVVLVATFVAQLSGGWDEVFDTTRPMPDDAEVVAARAAGAARVDAETQRLIGDVVLPSMTDGRIAQAALTGDEALAADRDTGLGSGCEVGRHDWKRDDPYDLSCIEIRRTVVAASAPAFSGDMSRLHEALLADGWTPRVEGSGLPSVLAESRGGLPPSSVQYSHQHAPYELVIMFQYFDTYTGRPTPILAEDEYAVMVSINHQSFEA